MKTIELIAGTDIATAARMLVANAPARATFNDIPIRAKYATTKPHDVVARYHRLCDEHAVIWANSPKGRAWAASAAAEVKEAQAAVDRGVAALGSLEFTNVDAVLAWVESMLDPCDHVDVKFNRAEVVAVFTTHGWEPIANCGDAINPDDARNVAGWIVGQWLKSGYPNLGGYIADWRAKFGTTIVASP